MYCQVTMRVKNREKEREIWFVLDTPHETLGKLYYGLEQRSSLYGHRLETEAIEDGDGSRKIVDRYETIIMRESIVAISELQFDLYDSNGKAVWTLERGEAVA